MKNVTEFVNTGSKNSRVNILKVEKKYNAKYVGQLCLKDRSGSWANESAEIFWQPTPPVEGYSNYFALIVRNGTLFITGGASAVEPVISAVAANNGEIVYSRYRHDYRSSSDGSVWVDGGRDYFKRGSIQQDIRLKIVDGEWYQLEDGES